MAIFGTIVLGGVASGPGVAHNVEAMIRGADVERLASTFQWVFAAACAGLGLAWLFLAMLEQRPLDSPRREALDGDVAGLAPAE